VGPIALGLAITGLGLFFLVGAFSVAGDAAYAGVGPRVFPVLIGAGLAGGGAVFTWQARRSGRTVTRRDEPAVDHGALAWIIVGLALAITTIQPLGFPVTSAVLFVTTSRAFGSRRPARDAVLGLVVGTVVYFTFARALGVTLPGGPLEWLL
jgi:putative tricarboxylic transport membrane protein